MNGRIRSRWTAPRGAFSKPRALGTKLATARWGGPRIRPVTRCRKLEALLRILESADRVLVFTGYRRTADYVARAVRELGVEVEGFHGGMSGAERHAAVERFRAGARVRLAAAAADSNLELESAGHRGENASTAR